MTPLSVLFRTGPLFAVLAALASCAPGIVPEPGGHHPAPTPAPRPSPPVAQAPDWQDWPVATGNWSYRPDGRWTVARFTAPGGAVEAWVRCDTATRTVAIGRRPVAAAAHNGGMMSIRTTFGVLLWPMTPATAGAAGLEAVRTASDPGLDQIAFSRGRFTIEQPGQPVLVLPTWAEPVRVIEDCRG